MQRSMNIYFVSKFCFTVTVCFFRATSGVGRRLACIGDEIEAKYGQEFTKFGEALNIRQGALDQASDAFRGVAMK